jgi:hypothetical protein
MPKSSTLDTTCKMAVRMRFDPPEPSTRQGLPFLSTTVGAIIDDIRWLVGHW